MAKFYFCCLPSSPILSIDEFTANLLPLMQLQCLHPAPRPVLVVGMVLEELRPENHVINLKSAVLESVYMFQINSKQF